MTNQDTNHGSEFYARWKADNKDSESFSRDIGYHIGHTFLDDGLTEAPWPEKIFQATQDGCGEPWSALLEVLGQEIGQKLTDAVQREEGEDYSIDRNEFAIGFCGFYVVLWAEVERLRDEERSPVSHCEKNSTL